jgi:hypothetical protein
LALCQFGCEPGANGCDAIGFNWRLCALRRRLRLFLRLFLLLLLRLFLPLLLP